MNYKYINRILAKLINRAGLISLLLIGLLTACSDSPAPTAPPASLPQFTPVASATSPVVPKTSLPTATTEVLALIPTTTPPAAPPPTRFPTATPRPGQTVPDIGPSLTAIRTTRVSFQTAYNKAAGRMAGVNGAARLVLAQSTLFTLDRSVWTFFFTVPQGTRSWTVTYDSGLPKDNKEQIAVLERSVVLLPDEAGQWSPAKILDSDEICTRLERDGFQPDLPLDTVYVQQVVVNRQGKLPAYILVNGALNKQLIINAANGAVIQNDFL